MDLMTLPQGKQLVLFQGYYNRPIEAEGEWYFYRKNAIQKAMAAKVDMGEASPIPEYLIPKHHRALRYSGTPRVYNPKTKKIKELK